MIATLLQGGLGNQLFQFAFASKLAAAHGARVMVDPYWFDNPRRDETRRTFELDQLNAEFDVADSALQRRWMPLRSRFAHRLPSFLLPLELVREPAGGFDPEVLSISDSAYLRGYWQDERYFCDISAQIAAAFEPRKGPSVQDAGLIELMEAGGSVSVHVRRGDYVSLAPAAQFHGTCSLDYYQRAVEHVLAHHEGCRFFVFSDDPEWTEQNLRIPAETHFVTHNSPADAVHDLRLMSHCQHHVIANSSFSWWGAWLSEQRSGGGSVVAPQRWFADRDAPGLVPPRWKRM